MKITTVEQFLESPLRNSWLRYRDLRFYMRKGPRLIQNRRVQALDLASIFSARKNRKSTIDLKAKRTGQFRGLDDLLKSLAAQHGFDGVYVENVLNEFLPTKLSDLGYHLVSLDSLTPCYWWQRESM